MLDLIKSVAEWAEAVGIVAEGTMEGQLKQASSELIELSLAIMNNEFIQDDQAEDDLKKEMGDYFVCGIVMARMLNLDIKECLSAAHNKNAARKGRMKKGQFVKEGS